MYSESNTTVNGNKHINGNKQMNGVEYVIQSKNIQHKKVSPVYEKIVNYQEGKTYEIIEIDSDSDSEEEKEQHIPPTPSQPIPPPSSQHTNFINLKQQMPNEFSPKQNLQICLKKDNSSETSFVNSNDVMTISEKENKFIIKIIPPDIEKVENQRIEPERIEPIKQTNSTSQTKKRLNTGSIDLIEESSADELIVPGFSCNECGFGEFDCLCTSKEMILPAATIISEPVTSTSSVTLAKKQCLAQNTIHHCLGSGLNVMNKTFPNKKVSSEIEWL